MDGETLRLEVTGGIAVITLDRPERRNAFTATMGVELSDAYRACDEDDDVRAVVLTGAPPAFCAGADLQAGGETFVGTGEGFSAGGVDFPAWRVRKPVIAAVNGHAIGIGLTLALQCDFRVLAAEATYGVVQARLGVMGDAWSHWTLPRLVGVAKAAEILLLGDTFDGTRRRGWASRPGSRAPTRCCRPPATWPSGIVRHDRSDVGRREQAAALVVVRAVGHRDRPGRDRAPPAADGAPGRPGRASRRRRRSATRRGPAAPATWISSRRPCVGTPARPR